MTGTAPVARRLLAAAALALSLAAAAPPAPAAEVRVLLPGTDTIQGTLEAGDSPRPLPFSLFEGAPFSLDVTAGKGSALLPVVRLFGPDGLEDPSAVFTTAAKGNKVSLRNYVPASTGLHVVVVGSAGGTAGPWALKSKVKMPKGITGAGDLPGGPGPVAFLFSSPGRAVGNVSVSGAPKEAGPPAFDSLRRTGGPAVDAGILKASKKGFSLKGADLSAQGSHSLLVRSGPGGAGTFKVKITWKIAPAAKRIVDASDVIVDPVLHSLDPSGGNLDQTLAMTLAVDFARPGAEIEFTKPGSIHRVAAAAVTHLPGEAKFNLVLSPFAPGSYSVTLRNPDGGFGTLADALAVVALPPVPASVLPDRAYEGDVAELTISGSGFRSGTTAALRKGTTLIDGAIVSSTPTALRADFDLDGAAIGAWDVVLTNPSAAPAILPGAFTVLEVVTLASMSPADNRDGAVVDAVILGTGFLPGATATLRRATGAAIPGTGLTVESSGEIRAAFDTTDAELGMWDLEVTVPGGAVRTLADAFRTRTPRGEPSEPVNFQSAYVEADGPPALAHDPTRGQFLVAWVEEDGTGKSPVYTVWARLVDAEGKAIDSPVSVSDDGGGAVKRFAAAGYDPVNDEYLVVWTEEATITPTQTQTTHPNGKSPIALRQVMAQRLGPSILDKLKGNVQVTDLTGYPGSGKGVTWYVRDFHSFEPALAFDGKAKRWEIAWMQEFDTSGLYGTDDYNVFMRPFDAATMTLGSLVQVATTDAHEGDPALAWDPVNSQMLVAYNARPSVKGGDLEIYLGAGGSGSLMMAGNGADLGDVELVVDAFSKTVVVSWTRDPMDGTREAEAAAVALSGLPTVVGKVLPLGTGATDMLVRPAANPDFEEVHLFWTRKDAKDQFQAMRLACSSSTLGGLQAVAEEEEVSSGGGDESLPAAVHASATGETAVIWLGKINQTGNATYQGELLPKGTVRGVDFWFRLYR